MKKNIRLVTGAKHWILVGVILLVGMGAYLHQHSAKASARGFSFAQTNATTTPSDLLW